MTNDVSAGVTAMVVVALLALVMRWVFKPSRPHRGLPVDAAYSPDLGMLTVVACNVPRERGMQLRADLGDAGIRSSMSKRSDGMVDVLVFTGDTDRARRALGPQ